MPAEKFLRTDIGSYSVVDLDGGTMTGRIRNNQDISDQVIAPFTAVQFTTPLGVPYVVDKLKAYVRGKRQVVINDDPDNGLFSLVAAPQEDDVPFIIDFIIP